MTRFDAVHAPSSLRTAPRHAISRVEFARGNRASSCPSSVRVMSIDTRCRNHAVERTVPCWEGLDAAGQGGKGVAVKERLVNIFVYGDATHVHSVGWRVYEKSGTYDEKIAFLQAAAMNDHRIAARQDLDEPVLWRDFEAMNRLNPFFGSLADAGIAGENDVHCLTHIVNGKVRADETRDEMNGESVPDYLTAYWSDRGLDFGQLINDDHFEAIHLLWNNRKYISSLKLVFCTIDTLGFVAYGPNVRDCFIRWLDEYCDLGSLGLTSQELWELRNSLIHMTNLDSRKVHSGKTHRVMPQFTHPDRDVAPVVDGMKVLHVARFLTVVLPRAVQKWLESYNQDRSKFAEFVERYDTIVSESRLVYRHSSSVDALRAT